MGVSLRAYAGEADLAAACALLARCLDADERSSNLSVAELRQVVPRPSTCAERNARLWEDCGRLVGFGLVWTPDPVNVVLLMDQALGTEDRHWLGREILEWVLARAGEIARQNGKPAAPGR